MANADDKSRSDEKLDILFVTSDAFPPFRPAAKAVFAEGLGARGHRIDWLMQAAEPSSASGERSIRSRRRTSTGSSRAGRRSTGAEMATGNA